jgi:hypothetical protein
VSVVVVAGAVLVVVVVAGAVVVVVVVVMGVVTVVVVDVVVVVGVVVGVVTVVVVVVEAVEAGCPFTELLDTEVAVAASPAAEHADATTEINIASEPTMKVGGQRRTTAMVRARRRDQPSAPPLRVADSCSEWLQWRYE